MIREWFVLIGVAFALIAVGAGVYLFFKKQGEKVLFSMLKGEEVDRLAMPNVIKFFKQPDILAKLRENKNFIAVVMKQNEMDGSIKVICCVFDKVKSDVVDVEHAKCFHARMLDADLLEAFGDKPMVILQ